VSRLVGSEMCIRDSLKAIRANLMVALLDERVPIGATVPASLTMHATWETDAWPLLQASIDALRTREDARHRFAQLAQRVAAKAGFPDEAKLWLGNRLDLVARNLPPNFVWDASFESAVKVHMEEAFQKGAMFDGVPRAPFFDAADVDICRIYAQTIAFEVFGYAWSREDALSPSQRALRASDFKRLLRPIQQAAEENRFVVHQYDLGDLAVARLNELYARESAQWKPWLVFPMRDPSQAPAAAAAILEALQREHESFTERATLPGHDYQFMLHPACVDWQVDEQFGNGNDRQDGLPWIMPDMATLFWDGYVALRRW
jgi:hypothetical protein